MTGTSDNFLPVVLPGGAELVGRIVPARLGPETPGGLLGEELAVER